MSSRQACVEGLHALGCMVEERDLTIMLQAGAPRDELLALLLNRYKPAARVHRVGVGREPEH